MTGCQCNSNATTIWCERHHVQKSVHWQHLCATSEEYFQAWEEGRGPGQEVTKKQRGPGPIRLAVNFSRAAVQHAKRGFRRVPEQVFHTRLEICQKCSWFNAKQQRCLHAKCGCFVARKLWWAEQSCPIGKWKATK